MRRNTKQPASWLARGAIAVTRRPRRGHAALAILIAAALGLVAAYAQDMANANAATQTAHYTRSQYPRLLSHWAAKRVKKNVDKTAWQYQLKVVYRGGLDRQYSALRPYDVVPGEKIIFNTPKGMKIKSAGRPRIRGTRTDHPFVLLRSVQKGRAKTLKFWAVPKPPNLAQRCLTVTAMGLMRKNGHWVRIRNAPLQRAKVCLPKAPKGGVGPQVLSQFHFNCYSANVWPNCMHDGVISVILALDDECGICYPYAKGIVPFRVVFYLPSGSKFSAKIHIGTIYPGDPKPTKADKQWHWQKVGGVLRPVWIDRHLFYGTIASIAASITVPGTPAQVCIEAVAQPLVWLPPIQTTGSECVVDPSVTTTTTTSTSSSP